MTYREFFSHVVDVVEAVGATILVVGGLGAFARFVREVAVRRGQDAYGDLRKNLGRVILLGLEVLIIADIIRTIVVDQSVESVVVLGTIVLIRVVLSFSLRSRSTACGHGIDGASLPKSPLPTSPEERRFSRLGCGCRAVRVRNRQPTFTVTFAWSYAGAAPKAPKVRVPPTAAFANTAAMVVFAPGWSAPVGAAVSPETTCCCAPSGPT
jgi:uncharacterized membrane protein